MTVSFQKALDAYYYKKYAIQSILTGRLFIPGEAPYKCTDDERDGEWIICDVVEMEAMVDAEVVE